MTTESMKQRRRTAQLLRGLASEIVTVDVKDEELNPIAHELERLRNHLAAQPRIQVEDAGLLISDRAAARFGTEPAYDRDPMIGLSNPLAPPLERVPDSDPPTWQVTFGDAYQGHPGFVHGGFVAAVIDHVLGVASATAGVAAMTGTLTIRYRKPTPLNRRLICEGWVTRVSGRKVLCACTLKDGETLIAEGEGIYLRVDPDRY